LTVTHDKRNNREWLANYDEGWEMRFMTVSESDDSFKISLKT
jgi:hypothetical protein